MRSFTDSLYDYLFTEPDIILLERQHRIYSIYLNNFIQDIINGKRALADDPDLAIFGRLPFLAFSTNSSRL